MFSSLKIGLILIAILYLILCIDEYFSLKSGVRVKDELCFQCFWAGGADTVERYIIIMDAILNDKMHHLQKKPVAMEAIALARNIANDLINDMTSDIAMGIKKIEKSYLPVHIREQVILFYSQIDRWNSDMNDKEISLSSNISALDIVYWLTELLVSFAICALFEQRRLNNGDHRSPLSVFAQFFYKQKDISQLSKEERHMVHMIVSRTSIWCCYAHAKKTNVRAAKVA